MCISGIPVFQISRYGIRSLYNKEKVSLSIDFMPEIHTSDLDRFYKTDLSRGKDKKGTGLGLSITREIIQAHNENINVISTEGVGTEFIFSLPLSEEDDD